MAKIKQKKEHICGSLCWICRHAGMIECQKPIKGWDAWYNPVPDDKGVLQPSWMVYACPQFEQDDRRDVVWTCPPKQTEKSWRLVKPYENYRKYDIFGEKLSVPEIVRRYTVNGGTFRVRMSRGGMTPSQAAYGSRATVHVLNLLTGETRMYKNREAAAKGLGIPQKAIVEGVGGEWSIAFCPVTDDRVELRQYDNRII